MIPKTSTTLLRNVRDAEHPRWPEFVAKYRPMSELKSASFPQFYSYGEANGCPYLAMELLEPGELPVGDRKSTRGT